MPTPVIVAIAVVVALLVLVVLFRGFWKVAEPSEALIISGLGAGGEGGDADSLGFKVVTGKGTLVLPGFQVARRLSLDLHSAPLEVECVTQQGIPVRVRGTVIYKVADDVRSIGNAARRFLDREDQMDGQIHDIFAGHLRSIVGGMTVEQLISDRAALTNEVRASSADEMIKLGLRIDSLQIQEIDDPTGYIQNLAAPHTAAVQAQARIAAAERDKEATEAEARAQARKAEALRTSQIEQAGYAAEVEAAQARSRQSGPLADAQAKQEVTVAETRAAELAAALAEQRLESEVRKPADAEAYRTTTLATAQRDAAIATAEAEAKAREIKGAAEAKAIEQVGAAEAAATKARLVAEADGINARAEALARNSEAVIAQTLAEKAPEMVSAAAQAFGSIDHLTVLNGADGVGDLLGAVMSSGGTGFQLAKQFLGSVTSGLGAKDAVDVTVPAQPVPALNGDSAAH